jgi:hypothetical protein
VECELSDLVLHVGKNGYRGNVKYSRSPYLTTSPKMGREGRNFKPSATPQVQIAERHLEENKIHEEPEIESRENNMITTKSRCHIRLASIVRDNSNHAYAKA